MSVSNYLLISEEFIIKELFIQLYYQREMHNDQWQQKSTLKLQLAQLEVTIYPPLYELLFGPIERCHQSLQALTYIQEEVKAGLKELPISLNQQISRRIELLFVNHDYWSQQIEAVLQIAIEQLSQVFQLDLDLLISEVFLPKVMNPFVVFNILDFNIATNKQGQAFINQRFLKELEFYHKSGEVLNLQYDDFDSIYWKRYQRLTAYQKNHYKVMILNQLNSLFSLSEDEISALYDFLPTFTEAWLLAHLLCYQNARTQQLVHYILSLTLIKMQNKVSLNFCKGHIHSKLITDEIIEKCLKIKQNYLPIFDSESILLEEKRVFMKYDLSRMKSITADNKIFSLSEDQQRRVYQGRWLHKRIDFLIERVTKDYEIYAYYCGQVFIRLDSARLLSLLNKLIIFYCFLRSQIKQNELFIPFSYFQVFSSIIGYTRNYSLLQSEKIGRNVGRLLDILTAETSFDQEDHYQLKSIYKLICYLNNDSGIISEEILSILINFIPKLSSLEEQIESFSINQLYQLKWKSLVQRNPGQNDITEFMRSYPSSAQYFSSKLEDITVLFKSLSHSNVFQRSLNHQMLCLATCYASDCVQAREKWSQSMKKLLKEHSSFLFSLHEVDQAKLAGKIGIDLQGQIEKQEQICLQLLQNNTSLQIETSQLCEKQLTSNSWLILLIKEINYFMLLMTMNQNRVLNKKSVRIRFNLLLQLEHLQSIYHTRIVEHQSKYSAEQLKKAKELYKKPEFKPVYDKIRSLVSKFSSYYWSSILQYSVIQFDELLRSFDLYFSHLQSGNHYHLLKCLRFIKFDLTKASKKKPIYFAQLYNYHKDYVFKTLSALWVRYSNYTEKQEVVALGLAYLEHIQACFQNKQDPLLQFQLKIQSKVREQLLVCIKSIIHEAHLQSKLFILNNQLYEGHTFYANIRLSHNYHMLVQLQEMFAQERLGFYYQVLPIILNTVTMMQNIINSSQQYSNKQHGRSKLDIQAIKEPIEIFQSSQEAVLKIPPMLTKLYLKLVGNRYCHHFFVKIGESLMRILRILGPEFISSEIIASISEILAQTNQGMLHEDVPTSYFKQMSYWRNSLINYMEKIRQLNCFSEQFVKNELEIIQLLQGAQLISMRESSLRILQELIPQKIDRNDKDAIAFVLFILHKTIFLAESAPLKYNEKPIQIINQILHKAIKIDSPLVDNYIPKLKALSKCEPGPFFINLLARNYEQISMEADIRGYFLKQYMLSSNEGQRVTTSLQKFIFTFQVKYEHALDTFSKVVARLAQKTVIDDQGEEKIGLSYDLNHMFHLSYILGQQFTNWKPSNLFRQFLNKMLYLHSNLELQTLQNIIYYHPFMLPYISLYPIAKQGRIIPLVDYLVEQTNESVNEKGYDFLHFICLDHNCILLNQNKPIFYSEYLCFRIIRQVMKIGFTSNTLLFLFYMTQIKRFNLTCKLKLDERGTSVIDQLIQFAKQKRKGFQREGYDSIIALMVLSTIYQQDEIESLKLYYTPKQHERTIYQLVDECMIDSNWKASKKVASSIEKKNTYGSLQVENTKCLKDRFQQLQDHLNFDYSDVSQRQRQQMEYSMESVNTMNLAPILSNLYSIEIPKIATNFVQLLSTNSALHHLKTADRIHNVIYNLYSYSTGQFSKRGTNRGKCNCRDCVDQVKEAENAKAIKERFEDILQAVYSSQANNNKEMLSTKNQQYYAKNEEQQAFIDKINKLEIQLNEQLLSLEDLSGQSLDEKRNYLEQKYLETEYDWNQRNMSPEQFENYLCSKSHQLDVLTSHRRIRKQLAESRMFALNMQRTASSNSSNYLIDVLDENLQNIVDVKRGLSQDVPQIRSVQFENAKSNTEQQKQLVLPVDAFSEIRQDLLEQIVLSLYYQQEQISYDYLDPFFENKKAQQKLINTLIYICRNPFSNHHFPSQLYEYDKQSQKWNPRKQQKVEKQEEGEQCENDNNDEEEQDIKDNKTILMERIIKVLQSIKDHCYYDNPEFLIEEIGLEGLFGIRITPNQYMKTAQTKNKHIPLIDFLQIAFDYKKDAICSLIANIKTISDSLLPKLFDFMLEFDDRYAKSKEEQSLYANNPLHRRLHFIPAHQLQLYKNIRAIYYTQNFINKYKEVYPFGIRRPNIYFLTELIGTPVYQPDEMRTIHLQILNTNKKDSQNLIFLNKVLQIYSDKDIQSAQWLPDYIEYLLPIIEQIDSNDEELEKQPVFRLFKFPSLMSFEIKVQLMRRELEKTRGDISISEEDKDRILLIRKNRDVFLQTFEKLQGTTDGFWFSRFMVKFQDERGVQLSGIGEGVRKQWFTLVTQAMVNLNYGLFRKTPLNFYYFSRESHVNPRHLDYFEFIGKLFAHSIIERAHFVCPSFSRILYKRLLAQSITIEDLIAEKFEEGEFYREMSVLQQLRSDEQFEELGITGMKFTYTDRRLIADRNYQLVKGIKEMKEISNLFLKEEQVRVVDPNSQNTENKSLDEIPKINLSIISVREVIELIPGGARVEVTFKNRLEYLRLLREKIIQNITKQVDRQYQSFKRGLSTLVDPKLLMRFSLEELCSLVEGSSQISGNFSLILVEELRNHITINGYSKEDAIIEWFFGILSELSGEDLAHFIHFWTGEPKIRRNGFKDMLMAIKKDSNFNFRVQTCFNLLYLPQYDSRQRLREMVLTSIENIKQNKANIEEN